MSTNALPSKPLLADYGYNNYSQYGEDGIIEKIFAMIGTGSKLCIEFGAWDGFYLANTANLWTQGWRGVLIEGDRRRFRDLETNTRKYGCRCINAYVAPDGVNSLESLVEAAGVTDTVDLLSVDIDGDDYYILDSLVHLRPRVIICEYNPTIPADLDIQASPGNYFGSSVAALTRLACERGYDLVALTQSNCFFVLREEVGKLQEFEMRLEHIRRNDNLTFVITSYAGDYVICGSAPYGFNYPYRGKLVGPVRRMAAGCTLFAWWFAGVRMAKNIAKSILRRYL